MGHLSGSSLAPVPPAFPLKVRITVQGPVPTTELECICASSNAAKSQVLARFMELVLELQQSLGIEVLASIQVAQSLQQLAKDICPDQNVANNDDQDEGSDEDSFCIPPDVLSKSTSFKEAPNQNLSGYPQAGSSELGCPREQRLSHSNNQGSSSVALPPRSVPHHSVPEMMEGEDCRVVQSAERPGSAPSSPSRPPSGARYVRQGRVLSATATMTTESCSSSFVPVAEESEDLFPSSRTLTLAPLSDRQKNFLSRRFRSRMLHRDPGLPPISELCEVGEPAFQLHTPWDRQITM